MIMPRLTPQEAEGLMNAYAKVHAPKEEPKTEEPSAEANPPAEESPENK